MVPMVLTRVCCYDVSDNYKHLVLNKMYNG